MPRLDAYLFFDGNCADAMRFYEKVLGGKLQMMKAKDAPEQGQIPPEKADQILHARLVTGEGVLMASDNMLGPPIGGAKGFSLSVIYPTPAEAKKVFEALAAGGEVTMPFGKTFWAEGFGMCKDRFGTMWMVNGGYTGGGMS
jgi:PhnB protein